MTATLTQREQQRLARLIVSVPKDVAELDALTMRVAGIVAAAGRQSGNHLPQMQKIWNYVANYFNVTETVLRSRERPWSVVWPRWLAIYFIRGFTQQPVKIIGQFAHKDHGAVLHALAGVRNTCQTDPDKVAEVAQMRTTLASLTGLDWVEPETEVRGYNG